MVHFPWQGCSIVSDSVWVFSTHFVKFVWFMSSWQSPDFYCGLNMSIAALMKPCCLLVYTIIALSFWYWHEHFLVTAITLPPYFRVWAVDIDFITGNKIRSTLQMVFPTQQIYLSDHKINHQLIVDSQNYLQIGDWPALYLVATNLKYIPRMWTSTCSTELVQLLVDIFHWKCRFSNVLATDHHT